MVESLATSPTASSSSTTTSTSRTLNQGEESQKQIKAIDSSADFTQIGLVAYTVVATARRLERSDGPVTPASVTAPTVSATKVDGIITRTRRPSSTARLRAILNHYGVAYKVVKGVAKRQGTFFDLAQSSPQQQVALQGAKTSNRSRSSAHLAALPEHPL